MRWLAAIVLLVANCAPCLATCNLDRVVGYTLVTKKVVAGYIQNDKKSDEFSGCDFDRILVFDDNTGVRCSGYSYHYAYRPTAYIFVGSSALKLCIDGDWFDAAPLR
jgi:hypothetical protein